LLDEKGSEPKSIGGNYPLFGGQLTQVLEERRLKAPSRSPELKRMENYKTKVPKTISS